MSNKKSVLVTGGSRGIGAEAVRIFSASGYRVAFLFKNADEAAKALTEETKAVSIKCNIENFKEVHCAVRDAAVLLGIAGFDVLICNAGISKIKTFGETTIEDWKEIMDTNLNGSFYVTKEVLPYMISNKSGKIVYVSSIWGQVGASCEVAYSASKAAIIGLTKSLAKEVGPSNINVNCVAPGVIRTDMNGELSSETIKSLEKDIPLCRLGLPSEVAETLYYLCSQNANYITGQVIGINGGLIT